MKRCLLVALFKKTSVVTLRLISALKKIFIPFFFLCCGVCVSYLSSKLPHIHQKQLLIQDSACSHNLHMFAMLWKKMIHMSKEFYRAKLHHPKRIWDSLELEDLSASDLSIYYQQMLPFALHGVIQLSQISKVGNSLVHVAKLSLNRFFQLFPAFLGFRINYTSLYWLFDWSVISTRT